VLADDEVVKQPGETGINKRTAHISDFLSHDFLNPEKLFAGSVCCAGEGFALITAVGDNTVYGRIGAEEIIPFDYEWGRSFAWPDSFTLLLRDFLTGGGGAPTLKDGLECCRVIDAVMRSCGEKRTVSIG